MRCSWLLCLLLLIGCRPRVSPVDEISLESSGVHIQDVGAPSISADDWLAWRGPSNNGVAVDQSLPTSWSESENVTWKAEVPGRGHSSPIVSGNQVFLATADESRQQQSVVAFRRDTGDLQWQTVVQEGGFPGRGQMHPKSTHANGTLACDGNRLYGAFLANDEVTAFALNLDGELGWKQTVCTFNSKFGYAPSPILYKSSVILAADNQGGGCLAALDGQTGQIAWRKPRPAIATYSSPVVAKVAGREQLLISGCHAVVSYDPESGEELWRCEDFVEATCGTIVCDDQHVFASGGYPERQTVCVAADGSGRRVWSNSTRVYEPSLLCHEGALYVITDDGIAHCFDAATGREQWKQRLGGSFSASPTICNGLVYVTNDRGVTYVFRATAERFEKVAENQLGDDTYASPAVSSNQLLYRVGEQRSGNRQEMLFCIGLPQADKAVE